MSGANIIAIAGSYHGSESWADVIEWLQRHEVSACATDFTELDHENLVECARALASLHAPERRNVIVAHSSAGHLASAHAELCAEHLAGIIYVAAALLGDGARAADIPRLSGEEPARPEYAFDGTFRWCRVETPSQRERVKQYFYNATPAARAELALERLRRQRVSVLEQPLRLSRDRFGSVKKAYVQCSRDRVIFPSVQRRMIDAAEGVASFALDADHSPFLSAPERLAELLFAIARGFIDGSPGPA